MTLRRASTLICLLAACFAGCGQKGPLYLPGNPSQVTTTVPATTPAPAEEPDEEDDEPR